MSTRSRLSPATIILLLMFGGCARAPLQQQQPRVHPPVTWNQITAQAAPAEGVRIAYGSDPLQFGVLRIPSGAGPHPVAVIVHGGCWRSKYDLRHIEPLSAAVTRTGIATWTVEYRRIEDEGGGWPGTFQDVAAGVDHLRMLAEKYGLDLDRVVVAGHSAGGHLALWAAGRKNLPRDSALFTADPLKIRGVAGLAAIADLEQYATGSGNCNAAVADLMDGMPKAVPNRYAQANPIGLVPFGVPVILLQGSLDPIVPPEQGERFVERALARGDDSRIEYIEGAGHFDVIAPFAPAWASIERAVHTLLGH